MKIYKVSKTTILHQIEIEAKDDKEFNELYKGGVVDEVLSNINPIEHYVITDEGGNIIREHKYT